MKRSLAFLSFASALTALSPVANAQLAARPVYAPAGAASGAAARAVAAAPAAVSLAAAAPVAARLSATIAIAPAAASFAAPAAAPAFLAAAAPAVAYAAAAPVREAVSAPEKVGASVAEIARRVDAGETSAMFTGETGRRNAVLAAPEEGNGAFNPTAYDFFRASEEHRAALRAAVAPAAPKPPRSLSMTEFGWLNAAGIAGSVLAGVLLHSFIIGLLGTYVAAIPLVYAYVAVRRLMGDNLNVPGLSFAPGFTWAGRRFGAGPKE